MYRSASAGHLLDLVRGGRARTRTDLASQTGLGRSAVSQAVTALIANGLLREVGQGTSTGGRRPVVLAFDQQAGVILAADLGATHSRIAVTDLGGEPLAEVAEDIDIARGPGIVLGWVEERFEDVLTLAGRTPGDVRGVGMGVPGPVEFATGRPVSPPIMPGWDGFPVPERFEERYGVPALVDNDVNIMALGEHRVKWSDSEHLLFVKVGTGIGCGIIAEGRIHRGALGAAGDLGHVRVSGHDDAVCHCGNSGCVEAVASGGAMARQLGALGLKARTSRDVVSLAKGGNPEAVRRVREAGRLLGQVLASAVNFFNPAAIVVGGDVADADQLLLAGVREVVYQRSPPLATQHLKIVQSALGDRAGIRGAAAMVIENVLSPDAVNQALAAEPPREAIA
jgi:predicted NBD/HSP70 family sugar kinase